MYGLNITARAVRDANGKDLSECILTDVTDQVSEQEKQIKLLDNLPTGGGTL